MIRANYASARIVWLGLAAQCMALCTACVHDSPYRQPTHTIKPCYPPKYSPVPNIIELKYHDARKQLLAAAWLPLRTKPYTATPATDPDIQLGNGPQFWEKEYFELEFCSPTGSAVCAFLFTDVYGNRLEVITEGEELPADNARATVTRFYFVCAAK